MIRTLRSAFPSLAWVAVIAFPLATACSRGGAPDSDSGAATSEAEGQSRAIPDADGPALVVPEEFGQVWAPWKGDLDGIMERRVLRMLVAYNATSYYIDRGHQGGLTYEAGRLLEKELNRRFRKGSLHLDVVFIPVPRDRLLPALVEGHGDVAASTITITEGRQALVDFTEPTTNELSEIVVTGPGAPPIARLDDLAGKEVYVRASSSFAESLQALNASFAERGLDPVNVVPADERLETEDVLEMVNAGVYPITVVDDFMVSIWGRVFPRIQGHPDVAVRTGARFGWAIRKGSPGLEAFLNELVRRNRQGTLTGNILIKRYTEELEWIDNPAEEREAQRFRETVDLFRKYGDRYGLDYLLLTAQAYQESGLDQAKRSRRGAIGIMQMLPSTARDPNVGIPDITSAENNVHAGVKYLRFILDRYFADADMDDLNKHLFAFASYNAGPSRIAGLRAKAERIGLDPNQWRGGVEVMAGQEIGRETVQYVANIFKYYLAYRLVEERRLERGQVKSGT